MSMTAWQETDEAIVRQLLAQGVGPSYVALGRRPTLKAVAQALIALANSDGGILLVGTQRNGRRLLGVIDVQASRQQLLDAGQATLPPLLLPEPTTLTVDGKTLLQQVVPPGLPHVYSFAGLYLTRKDAKSVPLTPYQLRRLLAERSEGSFESRLAADATLDDIAMDKVQRYFSLLERPATEPIEDFLLSRGCLDRDEDTTFHPTYAGLLLFGKDPQRFLRSAMITAAHYPGPEMGDEFVRRHIAGTLPEQIREAESFVRNQMPTRVKLVGWQRQEVPLYPFVVVREALVNAVAHRDYAIRGEGIRLLLFSDRLEVYSPGRLPGHVTLENMRQERFSRNETIVQVLADLGFIERLGYGIDRMVRAMQEASLPEPQFSESAAGFRVILQSQRTASDDDRRWATLALNQRQQLALAYLSEHGRITNREYRILIPSISEETVRRDLSELVEKGLLLKIGDRRATFYMLKE